MNFDDLDKAFESGSAHETFEAVLPTGKGLFEFFLGFIPIDLNRLRDLSDTALYGFIAVFVFTMYISLRSCRERSIARIKGRAIRQEQYG